LGDPTSFGRPTDPETARTGGRRCDLHPLFVDLDRIDGGRMVGQNPFFGPRSTLILVQNGRFFKTHMVPPRGPRGPKTHVFGEIFGPGKLNPAWKVGLDTRTCTGSCAKNRHFYSIVGTETRVKWSFFQDPYSATLAVKWARSTCFRAENPTNRVVSGIGSARGPSFRYQVMTRQRPFSVVNWY
jgi:hypothetical protein